MDTEYPGIDRSELVAYLQWIASDPGALYKWMKGIDGDPRPGGSALMSQRVVTYCNLHKRQVFYEPLSGHGSIMRAMAQVARVNEGAWVSPDKQDRVRIDLDVFESAHTAPRGRLELPRPGEQPLGVHSVVVVGWEDSGEILKFRNSWGVGWGDRGYGTVSRDYLERHLRDAWLSRNARYGLTRFNLAAASAAKTARETASIWLRENGRWRASIKHRSLRRRLYLYDAWSVEDQVPVTVIELRTGEDFRLGWAMLFHERDRTSVLKELFVWPLFRRQGYGTIIEREAADIARIWESTKIQVYLHSVDAFPGNRVAGSFFGRRAGYEWRWQRTTLPNLDAIGNKTL
jgi:GNAT superfamily N-acetyltransferase